MARPQSISDDGILEASERVMHRLGAHGFSVSEIAREIGLTRAAITMRFASMEALKHIVIERMVREFEDRLGAVQLDHGAAGLLGVAEVLSGMVHGREQFANFWMQFSKRLDDPVLIEMERRRANALRRLIASVMPETAVDKDSAVDAFKAHLIGSLLNWQSSDHPDATEFLKMRANVWIRLAGIPIEQVPS